jgi:type VI secretion system protein ImpC
MRVDVDNFDEVLARLAPTLSLDLDGEENPKLALTFKELDDFHPDALFQRLDVFQSLRSLRDRLLDPSTAAEAANEIKEMLGNAPGQPPPSVKSNDSNVAEEDDAAMLERLLGRPPARSAPRARLTGLIERIVAPHIVPATDQQQELIGAVDAAIGAEMRRLLGHPAFQNLESIWRGLKSLVSNLEFGESLQLYLLDATKTELAADIEAAGDRLETSQLHQVLVGERVDTPGGEPWSLLVGHFELGAEPGDLALLATLGAIASRAGGPFIAAADRSLLGCRSLADVAEPVRWTPLDEQTLAYWQALRTSPIAPWIGLTLPSLLARLPYGDKTDPVEHFDFEEVKTPPSHDALLWSNPALACAMLIGRAFQERGWEMQPGDCLEIADLPAYTYRDAGETKMLPCGGVLLSERAAESIMARGIMPLMSYRNRNAVRLARFQSVADPPTGLSGLWA